MKKNFNLLILACLTLLVGCKQDEISSTNNGNANNGDILTPAVRITIEDLTSSLPIQFTTGFSAVYKDESGTENRLKIAFIASEKERIEYGRIYTHDNFVVRLFSEADPSFLIEIDGYGLYTQSGDIQKVIGAILMPNNNNGSSSVSIIFNNGKPSVSPFDSFRESTTLNDKIFEKVYFSNSTLTPYESFSEIAFNFTEGVVAFRDISNKLWVFDRFEQ